MFLADRIERDSQAAPSAAPQSIKDWFLHAKAEDHEMSQRGTDKPEPTIDDLQNFLDVSSLSLDATGVGAAVSWIPDVANGGISLARGDTEGAKLSAGAAVPYLGSLANAERIRRYASKVKKLGQGLKNYAGTDRIRRSVGRVYSSRKLYRGAGTWLRGGAEAKIPERIGRQLDGRQFETFGDFRRAFWRTVADDAELAGQFSASNRSRMANGLAPRVPKGQAMGKNNVFMIHHVKSLEEGGALYDMANMRIVSPRRHHMHHHGR